MRGSAMDFTRMPHYTGRVKFPVQAMQSAVTFYAAEIALVSGRGSWGRMGGPFADPVGRFVK